MANARARVGLSRDHIVETALDIIAEVGVEQLSMRQLSTELGVSLGATYRHVPTKESLLSLCGRALYLRSYRPREPDEDAIEWVRDLVLSLYDLLTQHPGMAGYVVRAQGAVAPEMARGVRAALLEAGHTSFSADTIGLVLTYYTAGVLLAESEATIAAAGAPDAKAVVVAGFDFILRNYRPAPHDPDALPGRSGADPVLRAPGAAAAKKPARAGRSAVGKAQPAAKKSPSRAAAAAPARNGRRPA